MNIKKPSPNTMKEQAVRQAKDLLITVLILTAATLRRYRKEKMENEQ